MSDRVKLRPATAEEVRAERAANPTDMWTQVRLGLDEGVIGRAAVALWGQPVRSGSEGEWIWRLWAEGPEVPVYLAVGLLPPAILFSGGALPDEQVRETVVAELRRVLLED